MLGNIQTWRQQANAHAVTWTYEYDAADQLTAAIKACKCQESELSRDLTMIRANPLTVFGASILLGAAIWTALFAIVGDPFDTPLYPVALLASGVLLAALSPSGVWRWAVGVGLGELVAFVGVLALGYGGPLWAVGMLFLVVYSTLVFGGAAAFVFLRHATRR